jgi:threonine dehydrogenase-like Zn-dependent dehydrogenase
MHPQVEVTMVGLGSFADHACTRFGAAHLLHGTRGPLLEAAAAVTGGVLRRPAVGPPVLDGGYDTVFDCVGSPQTIDDALRLLRPGGELILVATSGKQRVDWSLVWLRELHVTGTVYYAQRPSGRRAFADAVDIASDVRPASLVTHRFPLDAAPAALRTAAAGPGAGAVKVVFVPP